MVSFKNLFYIVYRYIICPRLHNFIQPKIGVGYINRYRCHFSNNHVIRRKMFRYPDNRRKDLASTIIYLGYIIQVYCDHRIKCSTYFALLHSGVIVGQVNRLIAFLILVKGYFCTNPTLRMVSFASFETD